MNELGELSDVLVVHMEIVNRVVIILIVIIRIFTINQVAEEVPDAPNLVLGVVSDHPRRGVEAVGFDDSLRHWNPVGWLLSEAVGVLEPLHDAQVVLDGRLVIMVIVIGLVVVEGCVILVPGHAVVDGPGVAENLESLVDLLVILAFPGSIFPGFLDIVWLDPVLVHPVFLYPEFICLDPLIRGIIPVSVFPVPTFHFSALPVTLFHVAPFPVSLSVVEKAIREGSGKEAVILDPVAALAAALPDHRLNVRLSLLFSKAIVSLQNRLFQRLEELSHRDDAILVDVQVVEKLGVV